jgi:hypothetical protein
MDEIKRTELLLEEARRIGDRLSIATLETKLAALRAKKQPPKEWPVERSLPLGW